MLFPNPQTLFLGRTGDLAHLAGLCASGASIVTLWGPPGIGKTRLAIELGRRPGLTRNDRAARAWFCDLGAARDLPDVCATLARSLGLTGVPARLTPGWMGVALARLPPGLLVLDNFEQVAADAGETVGTWAQVAPDLCLLVTSRERLRLSGEITHEVLPLGDEAAPLFIDRASAWSHLMAGALDAEQVAALVARLDGIPLAIELAAARVDMLGIEGLLSRLAQPLEVLAHGARDAGNDHATLRRAIESSSCRLSPDEREVFSACAVFRGGFSLEAAEAVARPSVAPVLDGLQGLRDRSLLRCLSEGGAVRFAFYDAIGAFAREQLGARADVTEVRARHARHFLDPSRALAPEDLANLVEAAAFALDGDGAPVGVPDIVGALARIEPTLASDRLVELLDRALAACAGRAEPSLVRGHRALAQGLQLRGRLVDARQVLERALDLAAGDPASTGELWADLGVLHHLERDMAAARACYARALAISEELGDEVRRARCLGNLGAVHHDCRRYDEALEHYQRALAASRQAGNARLDGTCLANIGIVLQERGAFGRARAAYEAALERIALAGDRRLEAITRTNLGFLQHEVGEREAARASHEQALACLRDVVDPRSEGLCLGRLGMALAALGCAAEALAAARKAERLLAPLDDRLALAVLRLFRAFVDACGGATAETDVRASIAEARASGPGERASLVDVSDDARTAVRLIEGALAARNQRDGGILRVGPEARWFTAPGGNRHDLVNRQVLRRLLARLVEQHREAPGEGLSLDALREAGWPAERVIQAAAVNRVHVALTELRRRGLRACLLRERDRYLIDPAVRVELSER